MSFGSKSKTKTEAKLRNLYRTYKVLEKIKKRHPQGLERKHLTTNMNLIT
jgi:hypothetical protein